MLFESLSVGDSVRKIPVKFAIHIRKSKHLDEKKKRKGEIK
jgi:hypothetical protein